MILTFLVLRDGELLASRGFSLASLTTCLDTEPFSFRLGVRLGNDGTSLPPVAVESSVQERRVLLRYSSASLSTTSSCVSCSTALIRCTT